MDFLERLVRRLPGSLDFIFKIQRYRFHRQRNKVLELVHSDLEMQPSPQSIKRVLIIAHYYFSDEDSWRPATGNLFFEIFESAVERYGSENVDAFLIGQDDENWLSRLMISNLDQYHAFLVFGELNPDSEYSWDWDRHLQEIRKCWNGFAIFIIFDSVWRQTLLKIDRLLRSDFNVRVVTIDRDVKQFMRNQSQLLGPIFLPISTSSRNQILKTVEKVEIFKKKSLSFHGKMYPYRLEHIKRMRRAGIDVSVNQSNGVESRNYASYINDLNSSGLALCLSRANAQNINQLKCRLLEVALFGGVIMTDDKKLIGRFFPSTSFYYFSSIKKLKKLVELVNHDPVGLEQSRLEANLRADYLAREYFWQEIEKSCNVRVP